MADNPFIPDYAGPPPPPPSLFKYLPPERVDVLENCEIRFTPLLGTNDIFEVRQTFSEFAGPRMIQAFLHGLGEADLDAAIANVAPKLGVTPESIHAAAKAEFGDSYRDTLRRKLVKSKVGPFIFALNTRENSQRFLTDFAGRVLALSLSEASHDSVMWAHYGARFTGYVIEFDTRSPFFHLAKCGKPKVLHRVAYIDEKFRELMDDPYAALISKTSNWSYEREWRAHLAPEEADRTLTISNETVHLRQFPAEAVSAVIAGHQGSTETLRRISDVKAKFPNARFSQLHPVRLQGTFEERPI